MDLSLAPIEDYRHVLEPNQHEAVYFGFASEDGDIFGVLRLLFGVEDVLEMFLLRVGEQAWAHQQRVPIEPLTDPMPGAAGPALRMSCLEPWQRWRIEFDGLLQSRYEGEEDVECHLDFEFHAMNPPARYTYGPYQQAQQDGTMEGGLTFGSRRWEGTWPCYRDHSWGTRPMGDADGWSVVAIPDRLYAAIVDLGTDRFQFGRVRTLSGGFAPVGAPQIVQRGQEEYVEDPQLGLEPWAMERVGPRLVLYLGPAGHEEMRDEPRAGDLLRDEIGPVRYTSSSGEEIMGFLEQTRKLG